LITFNKETHTYTDGTGAKYASVTSLIKKYSNEFDPTGIITERYAFKRGMTVEAVKAQWKLKADNSLIRGNAIHKILEEYFKFGTKKIIDRELLEQIESLNITGRKRCEVMLDDFENKIAGISDLIVNEYGYNDLYDYKTNEDINFYNKYGDKLKYPLNHLDDCGYNKYALQLSLYAYMAGDVRRLAIIWINHNNKIQYIPVPFMKYEIIALLKHYANNK
jgi:hypothetical protein